MVVPAPGTDGADGTESGFGDDNMTVKTMVAAYEELICSENSHSSNSSAMEEQLSFSNPKQPFPDQPLAPIVFASTRCIRKKNSEHKIDKEYVPKYRYNRLAAMEGSLTVSGPVLRSASSHNIQKMRVSSAGTVKGTKRCLKKGRNSFKALDVIQFKETIQRLQEAAQVWNSAIDVDGDSEFSSMEKSEEGKICSIVAREALHTSPPEESPEKSSEGLVMSETSSGKFSSVLPSINTSKSIPSNPTLSLEYNPLFLAISVEPALETISTTDLNPLNHGTFLPMQQAAATPLSYINPKPISTLNPSQVECTSTLSQSAPTSPSSRLTYQPPTSPTASKPQTACTPPRSAIQPKLKGAGPLCTSATRVEPVTGLQFNFGPLANKLYDPFCDKNLSFDLLEAQPTISFLPSSSQSITGPCPSISAAASLNVAQTPQAGVIIHDDSTLNLLQHDKEFWTCWRPNDPYTS